MIELAVERLNIPVHVMIRPRRGNFLYTGGEFEVMLRDIELVKSAGARGVVLGILLADGGLDTKRTGELIAAARPMNVTFHRASDMCRDPRAALADLIEMGVDTLLTSGQAPSAAEGLPLIVELVAWAAGRINIMPGAGIHPGNIARIAEATGARVFHFSAREVVDGPMLYRNACLTMGDDISECERSVASAARIRRTIAILN